MPSVSIDIELEPEGAECREEALALGRASPWNRVRLVVADHEEAIRLRAIAVGIELRQHVHLEPKILVVDRRRDRRAIGSERECADHRTGGRVPRLEEVVDRRPGGEQVVGKDVVARLDRQRGAGRPDRPVPRVVLMETGHVGSRDVAAGAMRASGIHPCCVPDEAARERAGGARRESSEERVPQVRLAVLHAPPQSGGTPRGSASRWCMTPSPSARSGAGSPSQGSGRGCTPTSIAGGLGQSRLPFATGKQSAYRSRVVELNAPPAGL